VTPDADEAVDRRGRCRVNTDPEAAYRLHMAVAGGGSLKKTVCRMLDEMFGKREWDTSLLLYVDELIERMQPGDPIEEMHVIQMALTHARVLRLSALATCATEPGEMETLHGYADKAANTFRRGMLALAEYRKPPRGSDRFTAIRQANIAGQQMVVNGPDAAAQPREKSQTATNEQGFEHGNTETQPNPTLSPEPGDAGIAPCDRRAEQAVGAIDATANAGGKGEVEPQRPEARRTLSGG
jgi:hypothetical protein